MQGRVITSLLAVALALVLAVPAVAQTSPTTNAYGGAQGVLPETLSGGGSGDVIPPPSTPDEGVEEATGGDAPKTTVKTERGGGAPATTTGSLPFTGFETGLVGLAGLLLLGTGLAIRRASRSDS